DIGAALVHDALAVSRGMTRVVVVMVGVSPHSRTIGRARIEIADALEVRQEPDAIAEPQRARDISFQHLQTAKLAAARCIRPQRAGGAAAVALPARRVGGVAADDLRPEGPDFWPIGETVDLPIGEELRQAAIDI